MAKALEQPAIENELRVFLAEHLAAIHQNEVNWKFHTVVKRWQVMISQKAYDLFQQICKVIELDPKFKLPWTAQEVEAAIEFTNNMIL